jgi:hypothetical protein
VLLLGGQLLPLPLLEGTRPRAGGGAGQTHSCTASVPSYPMATRSQYLEIPPLAALVDDIIMRGGCGAHAVGRRRRRRCAARTHHPLVIRAADIRRQEEGRPPLGLLVPCGLRLAGCLLPAACLAELPARWAARIGFWDSRGTEVLVLWVGGCAPHGWKRKDIFHDSESQPTLFMTLRANLHFS